MNVYEMVYYDGTHSRFRERDTHRESRDREEQLSTERESDSRERDNSREDFLAVKNDDYD